MFEINKRIGGPQLYPQVLPGDQFSGSLKQSDKNLERLPLEFHLHAVAAQFSALDINFKDAEAEDSVRFTPGHATFSGGIVYHWLARATETCHPVPQNIAELVLSTSPSFRQHVIPIALIGARP